MTVHRMTIKAERWDQLRHPDRLTFRPTVKSALLSLLSIYTLVLPVCLFVSWFSAWTWLDPKQAQNLSRLQLLLALIWHSLLMTLFLLLQFWYLAVPVVWLNAVAISRRSAKMWRAELAASPNGGPAESLGNSNAGGGPPSVS